MIAPIAAALGLLVARRAPAYRPMARGLCAWAALGIASSAIAEGTASGYVDPGVGARARLVLGFALCAVSAWAVGRSFHLAARGRVYLGAWLMVSVVACAAPVGPWWDRATPAAMAAAALAEAAAWGSWRGRGQAAGVSQRVAGVVIACDVACLLLTLLLGSERMGDWGHLTAAAVVAAQVLWLARVRVQV